MNVNLGNWRTLIRRRLSVIKNLFYLIDLQNIYEMDKASHGRAKERATGDISFRVYDTEDVLKTVSQINPLNAHGRRFAEQRLQLGDKAIIGYSGDRPVFYGWLMFEEIETTYGHFRAAPRGTAFSYNLFTAGSHRRRGIMTQFYRYVRSYLKRREIHSLYVGITTNNHVSIRAHAMNGFRKIGYFYTFRIFKACFMLGKFVVGPRFSFFYD